MATRRQRAANRRNAKKSTGPRSRIGKQIVRLNSVTHGLTGQLAAVAAEDHAIHETFCAALIKEMAPATPYEQNLAQLIAHDTWRLHRAQALDNNLFAADITDDPNEDPLLQFALASTNAFLANARKFVTLTIYEQRISRAIAKNRTELRRLHEARCQEERCRTPHLTAAL